MTHSRWFQVMLSVLFVCACCVPVLAQSADRAQLEREIGTLWEQIKAKEALLLDASAEDKAAYAEFLEQPNRGLIRLLPREKFDYGDRLPIRGGGAYYSFVLLTHEYGHGSDIGLEQGQFKVGFAGFDFGFITSLGDLPLEEVTLEHPAVKALAAYQPPLTEPEIRAQQAYNPVKMGEFTYAHSITAKVGSTYALRSLNYENSDALVAFHVVRQDDDGGMILLWKMLKKFPAPKAIRQNQNK